MVLQGSSPNTLSPGLSLAMARGPPRRGRLDKQNEEIISTHNILLRLAALIIAWAPASQRPQNWRFCLNTLSALWWIYPLELGYFLFIHAPLQNICLFISQQECIQKRVLCQLGTNHKLQWNSWLWASLAVTRGEVIYTYPTPCGLQKTRMKYEQGTEEASLGANEMDSLDARGDCKYTMDATSQTEVVCQAGISFSWRTLRNRMKGTRRWHLAPWCLGDWRGKEIKPSRHEALPVHYKGNKAKFKKMKERKVGMHVFSDVLTLVAIRASEKTLNTHHSDINGLRGR